MTTVECLQVQTNRWRPFRRTKLVFKLEREFYESNPYMKIGKTPIKND